MRIHRYQGQANPYETLFEIEPQTQFYEQVVARNATMLSPYDVEQLGIDSATATDWAERGFQFAARNNGDFVTDRARFSREDLRFFGGLLTYFADTTPLELHRLANNNLPDKSIYASRRYEGKIASKMSTAIETRVRVPKLWQPHNDVRIVGFR